jgi:PAS domain S-box-containing protein
VTERHTERRGARKRDLFELFIEHVVDYAIFILDAEGRVTTWNVGAERLLGYSADEIVGQCFSRFFTPEDRQSHVPESELQTAVAEGRASDDRWSVRKDGTRFFASGVTTALRNGGALGFVKIMRDRTDAKQAEDEIRKLNQELTHKVQQLDASRKQLYEKVLELEKFEQVVVGRELRMAELEREIDELKRRVPD